MVNTTIVDGHLYITTGTVSSNTISHNSGELIDIWASKIDYNYDNPIQLIPSFISKGNSGDEKPTKSIDLKRITESLNISGYLIDESGETAKTKRNNLLKLASLRGLDDARNKRVLTVVWGTTNATDEQTIWTKNSNLGGAFIQKIMFSESAGYVGEVVNVTADSNPPERRIAVTIQLIRGRDI